AAPTGTAANIGDSDPAASAPLLRSNHPRTQSWIASRVEASRMRNGTSERNARSPVCSNRSPPSMPPATPTGSITHRRWPWPRRSERCASVAPRYPGHSATVLVTFAETPGKPTAISAGNERRVPPPAMAFTRPAPNAASVASPRSKDVKKGPPRRNRVETHLRRLAASRLLQDYVTVALHVSRRRPNADLNAILAGPVRGITADDAVF